MTYFLQGEALPPIKAQNSDAGLSSVFEGLGAAWNKAQLENDSNMRLYRERRSEYADRAISALGLLDQDDVTKEFEKRGLFTDGMLPKEVILANPKAAQAVVEMGRTAQSADPGKWTGIDLSDEGVEAEVNKRLQAEYEDAEQTLDMMPGGRGAAELIGSIGGITADIKNLPFLLAGGGSGSLMRVMGREAAINMAAEAAFLPSQFEMADRLNIPDPDVKTQLLMAAAGGAVFGGLVEGGSRALAYWKGRNVTNPLPGFDAATSERIVAAAENAIATGSDPLQAVRQVITETPPKPYILENPINPDRPPLILRPEDRITTERLPPVDGQTPEPLPVETITAQADAALDEVEAARAAPFEKKPFTQRIRSQVKIHPDGPLAQELRAQGVTARSMPGLFSRKGAHDLDNLVASEWEDAIPGISQVVGVDGHYLSRQGVIDALIEEASGRRLPTAREIELQARERDAAGAKRSPQEDFLAGTDSGIEGRLFINKDDLGFLTDQDVAQMVDAWLADRNWTDLITPAERAELVTAMRTNGGDAEYLVERMWERDVDYAALPPQEAPDYVDIPFGEDEFAAQGAVGQGVRTGSGPDADPFPTRGGGEGLGDDAGQAVIPGTERIDTGQAQRNRAEIAARQQQSKIGRLDQTRVEDDEGGLFGGAQRDMFSDPASKEAKVVHDNIASSIRDDIAADPEANIKVDMGDGKGERSVSSVLDELDDLQDFAEIISLCGQPKVKA